MKNLAIELKNVYEQIANNFKALHDKYIDAENIMKSDASNEKKFKLAKSFDMEYEEIIKLSKEADESVAKIGTAEERSYLIKNDEEVKKQHNSYLWYKEEAEYMYPHARGAVAVFLRDNTEQIFKEHEESKKQTPEKKSGLEKFFDSAKGPKVLLEDDKDLDK